MSADVISCPQSIPSLDRVSGFIGKRGSGKTVRLKRELLKEPKVLIFDATGDFHRDYKTFSDIRELVKETLESDSFHYSFVPEIDTDIEKFCRYVYALGNCAVCFDEIHLYATTYSMDPHLANLFRRGRHKAIRIYYATQRLASVNKICTSQTTDFFFFKMTDRRDIIAAQDFFDSSAEVLRNLKPGEHIRRFF